jgi:transcriptional regulator with AAA-type ATPase domain
VADEQASTVEFRSSLEAGAPLELVVIEPQGTHVLALDGRSALSVGRASAVDVRLDDPLVSERHAALRFDAGAVTVEDLGSRNGTHVGAQRVAGTPLPLALGEAVRLGATMLVVRRRPAHRPRPLRGHHHFMAHVEDACERATAGEVAVARLRTSAARDRLASLMARLLGPTDQWGAFAAHDFELLFSPAPRAEVDRRLAELGRTLPDARLGVAWFGPDGRRADQLLAAASDRLPSPPPVGAPGPVLASAALRSLYAKAAVIARSQATSVLILGETGTGKEGLARHLHEQSPRAQRPFVALDCGAIAPTLAEDQLFGHVKGAFSGAQESRPGVLEAASGGSVLLDEFQNLAAPVQAMLLRALEARAVVRLGSSAAVPIDVRVIVAASRDPVDAVASKELRADLHHRISAFRLTIPPLRDRRDDILPLARHFLATFCAREGRSVEMSEPAAFLLERYDWPGNARELRNIIERAVVLSRGDLIEPDDLDLPRVDDADEVVLDEAVPAGTPLDGLPSAQAKQLVTDALIASGCVKHEAARLLGLGSKTALLRKMDELGLPRPTRSRRG